jgi:hypothetical protein
MINRSDTIRNTFGKFVLVSTFWRNSDNRFNFNNRFKRNNVIEKLIDGTAALTIKSIGIILRISIK